MSAMSKFEEYENDICPKCGGDLECHSGQRVGWSSEFDCEIVEWNGTCCDCGETYRWEGYENG